ncbi:MAG: molybdenum cofactor guanylyltransferase MobA [Proteobacteria bacterium]|nr:molybdenum cofactor guanylyltransferase MobA [Pseudomonadota bacterium]
MMVEGAKTSTSKFNGRGDTTKETGGVGDVMGIVLAGGQARRMGGGDKPLLPLAGKPLLAYVLGRLAPQVAHIAINSNSPPRLFAQFNLPVIADQQEDFLGPLAGILAGLDYAASTHRQCEYVLSVAGDTPFFPRDLAGRLTEARAAAKTATPIIRAVSHQRPHPVFALWHVGLRAHLRDRLINHEVRKIDAFTADYEVMDVAFAGVPDPFFNINTPEDMATAERILRQTG